MKQHLQRYIGWYLLAISSLLIYTGQSEAWIIFVITLLKIPPFDWVGRALDWAGGIGVKWGLKLKAWKDTQSKPVRVVVTIIAAIIILLLLLFGPECDIC